MILRGKRAIAGAAFFVALLSGGAVLADVKAGVDAWSRGDYATAVQEWQGPAAAGDADAMFNLAQAYRLGRGVTADAAKAEELYARAAAKGHIQAADTYGLMLFQDGRHEAAMPYIEAAAKRGDPRSEYLLGIASFNGDGVAKDWVSAYALLTMANAQSLPQAAPALAQMDQHIPLAQRQQAAALAVDMQKQAEATRGRELAAADLGAGVIGGARARAVAAPAVVTDAPLASPAPKVGVSPSVAAAEAAVHEARQATGTESPATAGASFARQRQAAPSVAATASPKIAMPTPAASSAPTASASASAAPTPRPTAPARAAAKPAAAPASASGSWKVQLGAFAVRDNVERLWTKVSGREELAGKTKLAIPAGAVTKLQAGGFATREAAETACRSLKRSGQECLVTR